MEHGGGRRAAKAPPREGGGARPTRATGPLALCAGPRRLCCAGLCCAGVSVFPPPQGKNVHPDTTVEARRSGVSLATSAQHRGTAAARQHGAPARRPGRARHAAPRAPPGASPGHGVTAHGTHALHAADLGHPHTTPHREKTYTQTGGWGMGGPAVRAIIPRALGPSAPCPRV